MKLLELDIREGEHNVRPLWTDNVDDPEDYISNYYEAEGYNVINISPRTNPGTSIPKEILEAIREDLNTEFPTTGVPDLLVFDHEEYFFVEVKGSRDSIRVNQVLWALKNPDANYSLNWIVKETDEIKDVIQDGLMSEYYQEESFFDVKTHEKFNA